MISMGPYEVNEHKKQGWLHCAISSCGEMTVQRTIKHRGVSTSCVGLQAEASAAILSAGESPMTRTPLVYSTVCLKCSRRRSTLRNLHNGTLSMAHTAVMGRTLTVLAASLQLGIPPAASAPVRANTTVTSRSTPLLKPSWSTIANAVQNPGAALHGLLLAVNESGP